MSSFAKNTFPKVLLSDSQFTSNPSRALKNSCNSLASMLSSSGVDATLAGSTLCSILIQDSKMFVANVGDSRAMVALDSKDAKGGLKPAYLTRDHVAANPTEKKRILECGGRIKGKRIYCGDKDLPGLIPSRSIGDFAGRPAGIISEPDVTEHKLDEKFNFLMIMSDGVWENVPLSRS